MTDLTRQAGPVFDAIFEHVDNPPSTPVADNADAFVEWSAGHLLHAVNLYTAYPDITAKEIKALAAAAGVTGAGELHPFLVILSMKSKLAFIEVQLILRARGHGTTTDLDKIGTPHFAQFVPLEDNQIGFFTVYDGSFDKYIADCSKSVTTEAAAQRRDHSFAPAFRNRHLGGDGCSCGLGAVPFGIAWHLVRKKETGFVRLLTARPSAVAGKTVFTYTGETSGIPVGNAPSILDKD